MQITLTPVSISSAIFAGYDDYKEFNQATQQYIVNPNKVKLKFAVRCSLGNSDNTMYSASDCYSNKWFISMKVDRALLDEFFRKGIKESTKGNLLYLCKSLVGQDKRSIDYFQYLDFQPETISNNAPPKMPATAGAN